MRLFAKADAKVQVVLTEGAKSLVTDMTLQAVFANPIQSHLLDIKAEAGSERGSGGFRSTGIK